MKEQVLTGRDLTPVDEQLACLRGENSSSESQEELVGLAKDFGIVLTQGRGAVQRGEQLRRQGRRSLVNPHVCPTGHSMTGSQSREEGGPRGEPTQPSRA